VELARLELGARRLAVEGGDREEEAAERAAVLATAGAK